MRKLAAALTAVALLSGTGVAFAQTTDPNASTTVNTTTAAPSSVTTPGTPNTGAGGDAPTNWAVVAVAGLVAVAGVSYLSMASRRPRNTYNNN